MRLLAGAICTMLGFYWTHLIYTIPGTQALPAMLAGVVIAIGIITMWEVVR